MSALQRETNLRVLLDQLGQYALADEVCRGRRAAPPADCARLAREMPLSHCRSQRAFKKVVDRGRLSSRRQLEQSGDLQPKPDADEVRLGTQDYLFTYAGPALYPRSCGLLLRARVEEARQESAVATPFDSGGLVHFLQGVDSDEQRREFLSRHELPVPAYREYLALRLRVQFAHPLGYVDGTGPDKPGPIGLASGDARDWTMEVRFWQELPLDAELLAVLLPLKLAHSPWGRQRLIEWDRRAVEVVPFLVPGGDSADLDSEAANECLRRESVQYLLHYLSR